MQIEKEIKEIKIALERIENILTSRLIDIDEPKEDEIEEIKEYEKKKREGKLELNEI